MIEVHNIINRTIEDHMALVSKSSNFIQEIENNISKGRKSNRKQWWDFLVW